MLVAGRTELPQPEMRQSSDGVLDTVLRAHIAANEMTDQLTGEIQWVHTPTYSGTIPGPTLVLKPRRYAEDQPRQQLAAEPADRRGGRSPHDLHALNFHTRMDCEFPRPASQTTSFASCHRARGSPIKIVIPDDHPSGTFWSHPHVHEAATYQFVSGMAGFLIIKGGPGTLDELPEIKAAKDLVMGFQVIRADLQGEVPEVNQQATQFGTSRSAQKTRPCKACGALSAWTALRGGAILLYDQRRHQPTLHMRPGEVQRWRLLAGAQGENFDSLTAKTWPKHHRHGRHHHQLHDQSAAGTPLVMAPGQRYDVLVKAGAPGTYQLQAIDPGLPASVSPSGIAPASRDARMSFDFQFLVRPPVPGTDCTGQLSYPFPMATVVVDGDQIDMALPSGPLPPPTGMPSVGRCFRPRRMRCATWRLSFAVRRWGRKCNPRKTGFQVVAGISRSTILLKCGAVRHPHNGDDAGR